MTIDQFNFAGKKAFVRVDFNVPLDENFNITDDTRMRAALPTLKKILADGGSVIIGSHLGRPKGPADKFSLKHILKHLEELLGVEVQFANDCMGEEAAVKAAALQPGEVLLLENLRFYAEEAKRYRGKNDLVLRTLMKLPYMNMKPDSREFSVLHTAGYSMDEITMANSLAVWADRIPDRLSSKGIVAEKIAVACVRMLLNGPDGQPEEIYAYISWLFQVYKKFEVRYEG